MEMIDAVEQNGNAMMKIDMKMVEKYEEDGGGDDEYEEDVGDDDEYEEDGDVEEDGDLTHGSSIEADEGSH